MFNCILVSIPFQDSRGSYPDLGPAAKTHRLKHRWSTRREGEGGPRSVKQAAVVVLPKEQRELQLKTGMVTKNKLEAAHPHNAVLCEQLSLT